MNLVLIDGKNVLKIDGKSFVVEDAIEYITLADSFVKNKIGTGHGEGKLYVGQQGRPESFFGDFDSAKCFVLKKDFLSFLDDAKTEYETPQQDYQKRTEMPQIFIQNLLKVNELQKEVNYFQIYRVQVAPPRVYINSNSEFYELIRILGLPNISYLSILKLKDAVNNSIYFYFRIFVDYKNDIVPYNSPEEEKQIEDINKSLIPAREKQVLTNARIGQGEYREKLLEECPFCPFTMVNDERMLIASHIKPWAESNDDEKIDPKNGFMLTPTYDRLFDRGFISFEDDKTLLVSPWLSPMNQKRLDIYSGKKIERLPLDSKRIGYLKYHREHIFKS
jgi:predicted restriction endonuclease